MIIWPDRSYSVHYNPAVDTAYTITKPLHTQKMLPHNNTTATFLKPIASSFDKHAEDNHVDFYNERNIPGLLSREGPKADTADVNNDGLTDIYVGGAANQPGQLYMQQSNGRFIKKAEPLFDRFAMFEDTEVLFFDCDNDGYKDLFLGAGGNNRQQGMPVLLHRLYIYVV